MVGEKKLEPLRIATLDPKAPCRTELGKTS